MINIKPKIELVTLTTGETVFVRVMSSRDADTLTNAYKNKADNTTALYAALTLCDENGNKLYQPEALGEWPHDLVNEIAQAADKLNYPEKKTTTN